MARQDTLAEREQLRQQIIDVLGSDHPLSVRHVFYRMTDPRLPFPVPKTDKGEGNGYRKVAYALKMLRRQGRVPYGWISDATRRGYHVVTYRDGADFLRANAGLYRGNLWATSGVYVEVWCESRSIAGVIEDLCEELAVSLYPAGGFASISLVHEAAEQIAEQIVDTGKPAHVIYIGDYDPAGDWIDQVIERELRIHLPAWVNLTFHRIAITEEQARELPGKPRKKGDKRKPHILETVEAEAMPANTLRQLLRGKVESFLPAGALETVRVAELSEQEGLLRLAERVKIESATREEPKT